MVTAVQKVSSHGNDKPIKSGSTTRRVRLKLALAARRYPDDHRASHTTYVADFLEETVWGSAWL